MINTSQIIGKLDSATGTTVDHILDVLVMAGKAISSDDACAVMNATTNSVNSSVKAKAIKVLSRCTEERMAIDSILALAFDGCTAVKGRAIIALLGLNNNKATEKAMSMIERHEFNAVDMEVVEAAAQVDIETTCEALDQMRKAHTGTVGFYRNIAILKLSWTYQHAAIKYVTSSHLDSSDTTVFKARIMGKVYGPPCEEVRKFLLGKVDEITASGTANEPEQEVLARLALNCSKALGVIEADKHFYTHALDTMEEMITSGKHQVSLLEEVKAIYSLLVQFPLDKGWGKRTAFCAKMGWVDVLSYAIDMVYGSKQDYFYIIMKEAMENSNKAGNFDN